MKTPFTSDQFIGVFKSYNDAVFPAQLILCLSAFFAIYLIFKPTSVSGKIISGILSISWLWMGITYHLIFFTKINHAAYIFGAAYILQSFLFLTSGVFRNKLSFSYRSDIYGITGIILLVFALFIYPVLGYAMGHRYPSSPTYGLPCPTTIFTFGILLHSNKKCPLVLCIIPFIWSLIGFSAAINFGIWEDTGLLIAGSLTLLLLVIKNKKFNPS